MNIKSKSEDLAIFVTIAECGSFTKAADILDIQVARVSRSVARLEKELSVNLLNRTTRHIDLTEEGQVFLIYARQAIETISLGEERLNSLKNKPSGKLRVDAASPFIHHQIVNHIQDFKKAFPDITIELISHENLVDLIEHKTDIAIRVGALQDSNLHARRIGRSTLHMVASPAYIAQNGSPRELEDLHQHHIIGFTDSPKLNNWHLLERQKLTPSMTASSGQVVRDLVLQGNGIALLSSFMINQDLTAGHLVEVLPGKVQSPNPREDINAVYYKNSAVSSRIISFLDFFESRWRL